nr:low affinity iron permease family protein [Achromobacter sp.]
MLMARNQSRKESQSGRKSGPSEKSGSRIARLFDHLAAHATKSAGSSTAFCLAIFVVLMWAISGPAFGYSETWQLVINTGTTIITFLMVFLIQQSQNKDSEALHLKLDELLIAIEGADEGLVDAERLDEDQLLALAKACTARARRQGKGGKDRANEPHESRRNKRHAGLTRARHFSSRRFATAARTARQ